MSQMWVWGFGGLGLIGFGWVLDYGFGVFWVSRGAFWVWGGVWGFRLPNSSTQQKTGRCEKTSRNLPENQYETIMQIHKTTTLNEKNHFKVTTKTLPKKPGKNHLLVVF